MTSCGHPFDRLNIVGCSPAGERLYRCPCGWTSEWVRDRADLARQIRRAGMGPIERAGEDVRAFIQAFRALAEEYGVDVFVAHGKTIFVAKGGIGSAVDPIEWSLDPRRGPECDS